MYIKMSTYNNIFCLLYWDIIMDAAAHTKPHIFGRYVCENKRLHLSTNMLKTKLDLTSLAYIM